MTAYAVIRGDRLEAVGDLATLAEGGTAPGQILATRDGKGVWTPKVSWVQAVDVRRRPPSLTVDDFVALHKVVVWVLDGGFIEPVGQRCPDCDPEFRPSWAGLQASGGVATTEWITAQLRHAPRKRK